MLNTTTLFSISIRPGLLHKYSPPPPKRMKFCRLNISDYTGSYALKHSSLESPSRFRYFVLIFHLAKDISPPSFSFSGVWEWRSNLALAPGENENLKIFVKSCRSGVRQRLFFLKNLIWGPFGDFTTVKTTKNGLQDPCPPRGGPWVGFWGI